MLWYLEKRSQGGSSRRTKAAVQPLGRHRLLPPPPPCSERGRHGGELQPRGPGKSQIHPCFPGKDFPASCCRRCPPVSGAATRGRRRVFGSSRKRSGSNRCWLLKADAKAQGVGKPGSEWMLIPAMCERESPARP